MRISKTIWVLAFVFVFCFAVSILTGRYNISPSELFRILFSGIFHFEGGWSAQSEAVVFNIRLPRVLAAALIGAGLSVSGAACQSLFNNPLVSPGVLGAQAGAGFGAALALTLGAGYTFTALSAFVFSLAAVLFAVLTSSRARQNPVLALVLAGIMTGSLFSSATSYVKLIADTTSVLPAITYWLMGSLSSIRMFDIKMAFPPLAAGVIILFVFRWQLNIITMGEDEARSMGVNTKLVRCFVILGTTLVTAACVSISGMIGWVGLVIPHFARMFAGYDNRVLLPASMLLGASYLMMVDNAARSISTTEIPIGILTSFVGAPFFLYLVINRGNRL